MTHGKKLRSLGQSPATPRPCSVSLFSVMLASPCIVGDARGAHVAATSSSAHEWRDMGRKRREENGVGASSMWIDGQDLAARLEHQGRRSYCVWLKPHQSEAAWLELERRQAASTAALACPPLLSGSAGNCR